MFWPCETRTSTCRSFATISSGLYRFLAIAVLLDVKDIPQVGPLQWGWINPSRFNGRKRMWCYRSTALKLKLRRALQVSAEGFTERHIAAQLTEPQWLDRVDTAIARWPTAAANTWLTGQATSHLAASTAAATP